MQEYLALWKNYVNFHDRTTVRGYWMAILVNIIISVILGLLANLPALGFLSYISGLYGLAILIPSLAICVRRLRDAGKGWGYIFISLIPLVGWIVLIVFLAQPSVPGHIEGVETV